MSDERAVITVEDQIPSEYGDRQSVAVLGKRIKSMLPGGDKLTDSQAMAIAQYSMLLDANPFRGEVYGYTDRHGFHLVDGYKMLVRWARKTCPYTESYTAIEDLPDGAIGYRCHVLRDDARATLQDFVKLGATFPQAYELTAVSAVGVVTKADMTTRDGRPMDPPSGWTWDQVARKRALKNALNLSHGAPSPREIAAQSWVVEDTETRPEDWRDVTSDMPGYEREAVAAGNARIREAHERAQELAEQGYTSAQATADLFADYIIEPVEANGVDPITAEDLKEEQAPRVGKDPADLIAKGKSTPEPPEPKHWIDDPTVRARFWAWTGGLGLSNDEVHDALMVESVKDFGGTMAEAKSLIETWLEQHAGAEPQDDEPPF